MTGLPDQGPWFDDFMLGQHIVHATPRTIGDGEAAVYFSLTGSRNALASADETARLCGFPKRPLDSWLVFNIAFGKTVREISANAVANLGYAELRFMAPVFAGDTLRCESDVIGLRATSKGNSGIVYVRSTCFNQRCEQVLKWVRWVLLPRRNTERPAPASLVPDLTESIAPNEIASPAGIESADALGRWCAATGSTRLWDDYEPGQTIIHPMAMTVGETDHMSATRLYQNLAQVHFVAGAENAPPLVYGGHVISLCQALAHDGLENLIHPVAVNAGSHRAPVGAGDELRAVTHVVNRYPLPGRNDIAAVRLRLLGLRNLSVQAAGVVEPNDPAVVLDLDYTAIMPRR